MGLFARAFKKENPEEHFKENTLRQQAEFQVIQNEMDDLSDDIRDIKAIFQDLTNFFAGIQLEEKKINRLYVGIMNNGHKMSKEQTKEASLDLKESFDEMIVRENTINKLLKNEINNEAGMRAKIRDIKSTVRKMDNHIRRNDRFVQQLLKYTGKLKDKIKLAQGNMPTFGNKKVHTGHGRRAINRMKDRQAAFERQMRSLGRGRMV